MATYKLVCRHVRYWRGAPHHWSTVYHYTGSTVTWSNAFLQTMAAQDGKMCYGGSQTGGTYQVEVYNASGGQPLLSLNLFDPSAPANWPGYLTNSVWPSTGLEFMTAAEVALSVSWATGGVSSSGKAVYLRKWYHAVGYSTSAGTGSSQDISAATVTALTTAAQGFVGLFSAQGLALSGPSGNAGTVARVAVNFGNHQMPRGRRTTVKSASKSLLSRLEGDLGSGLKIVVNNPEAE